MSVNGEREPAFGLIETTHWRGEKMLKAHSLKRHSWNAAMTSMRQHQTVHTIVGTAGSGKTTLAQTLAHLIHEAAWKCSTFMPVYRWGPAELANADKTLNDMPTANAIIVVDDAPFMADDMQFFPPTGGHVVVIATANHDEHVDEAHMSDFWWITAVNSAEFDVLDNAVWPTYGYLRDFMNLELAARQTGQWGPRVESECMYAWRKPFAPAMLWNGYEAHLTVYPERAWINDGCGICDAAMGVEHEAANLSSIFNPILLDHGSNTLPAARAWLMAHGVNPHGSSLKRVMNRIERTVMEHNLTPANVLAWVESRNRAAAAWRRKNAKALAAATGTEIAVSKNDRKAPESTSGGMAGGAKTSKPWRRRQRQPSFDRKEYRDVKCALLARDGPVCQTCQREFADVRMLEIDHKTSVADGGTNDMANLQLLCGPCNKYKDRHKTNAEVIRYNKSMGYWKAPLGPPPKASRLAGDSWWWI